MAHNLSSKEIRKMYNLLYRFEHVLHRVMDKTQIMVESLPKFQEDNDIYIDTINKENELEGKKHRGFFLYRQAKSEEKAYRLISHLRNAFAHGFVELNKKTVCVSFKDGDRKIKGELPRELVVPLIELLYKAIITETKSTDN